MGGAAPDSEPTLDLRGRLAVVTGGAGILGSRFCRDLARHGARVVIADADAGRATALAEELARDEHATGTARATTIDLADEESVAAWAQDVLDSDGVPDVLVNNAAAKSPSFFAPVESFPLPDWNAVMAVNVTGVFLTLRAFAHRMAERGSGSIVNVGSIYGVAGPDQRIYDGSWYEEMGGAINTPLVYSASKAALGGITRWAATRWGPAGVRCNTLVPGGVRSGQNDVFVERYSQRVPMNRMAEKRDISGALLFLASDASAYVNGHSLVVDGGLTAW